MNMLIFSALLLSCNKIMLEAKQKPKKQEEAEGTIVTQDKDIKLISAVKCGDLASVISLLSQDNNDVNVKDDSNITALGFAAMMGYKKITEVLLADERIDVNAKSKNGETAIHWAAQIGHIEVVKVLLESEILDINSQDANGNTALHCAASRNFTEVISILLKKTGIDKNIKNNKGETALDIAKQKAKANVEALFH